MLLDLNATDLFAESGYLNNAVASGVTLIPLPVELVSFEGFTLVATPAN